MTENEVTILSPNPFYKLMYNTPLRSIIPANRHTVTVPYTLPVTDVLALLHKHKILSVPVIRTAGGANKCLGFIDVLSILTHAINNGGGGGASSHATVLVSRSSTHAHNAAAFLARITAAEVVKAASTDRLVPVFSENPVSMMVDFMSTGIHRVALFGRDRCLSSICSQSDLIAHINTIFNAAAAAAAAAHEGGGSPKLAASEGGLAGVSAAALAATAPQIAAAGETLASTLGVFKPVETVAHTAPLIDVLQRFASQRRSAFAVVDEAGRLVCDVATSDLHDLTAKDGFPALFASLDLPVLEWLKTYSSNQLSPVCTTATSTLRQLVMALAGKRLHRLWVIDDDGKPTHLASLTDVLAVFSSGDRVDARMASGDTATTDLWSMEAGDAGGDSTLRI